MHHKTAVVFENQTIIFSLFFIANQISLSICTFPYSVIRSRPLFSPVALVLSLTMSYELHVIHQKPSVSFFSVQQQPSLFLFSHNMSHLNSLALKHVLLRFTSVILLFFAGYTIKLFYFL